MTDLIITLTLDKVSKHSVCYHLSGCAGAVIDRETWDSMGKPTRLSIVVPPGPEVNDD